MKTRYVWILIAVGVGLALGLVLVVGGGPGAAYAQGPDGYSTYYVAPSCAGVPEPCFTTVQGAVDAADDVGDVIKVATGVYTGVSARPAPAGYDRAPASGLVTQVVYITKTVTVRGGYAVDFAEPPDPEANPTTLDAEGQGRVLLIVGNIAPTIEGLRITGGDVSGLGGAVWQGETLDVGGGVYVITATATIKGNRVFSNTAPGDHGLGGGLCLVYSDATVSGNIISTNTAREGGGVKLAFSDATVSGNTFSANVATRVGGGLGLYDSDAMVRGNTFSGNTAGDYGGGLDLTLCSDTMVSGNTFSDNSSRWGGGLQMDDSDATLINNVIADNRATDLGSGLYIYNSSQPRLLHNTIARNSDGDGSGVYVDGEFSLATLDNTILVGHSVGIEVAYGNTARLEGTLWGSGIWANDTDRVGSGISHSDDRTGDPAFVDADAGNYHIGPGSAAIDAGVETDVTSDIDGDPRPAGAGYDIGADEYYAALEVIKEATPDPAKLGAPLTYTIQVVNTGSVDLHATVTDTLPFSVTLDRTSGGTLALPGGTVLLPDGRMGITWTAVITASGDAWMGTVVVMVDEDAKESLTNEVAVTTAEGAAGEVSVTVDVGWTIYLPLVMRSLP